MRLTRIQALRGPNIWARFPVLEVWVDLGEFQDSASNELPGFNERLTTRMPSLIEHRCSVGERGGFFQRLERGTYLAHILEHIVLELQSLAGTDVGYGKTRMTNTDGLYKMAIEYDIEELGLAAVPLGVEYCLAAIHDRPFDLDAAVAQLREVHETHRPHPLTQAIQEAARARRIPCRILDEASQLVQLGYGTAQRRLLAGQSDRSSAVGSAIGADRELTRMMLQAAGVPVPAGGVVNSAEAAWKEADYHGLPAMLRPRYTSAGDMIHGPLNSQDEVYNAYYAAEAEGFTPMVEAYHAGDTFRVLVLGAHVVAAVRLSDGGPIAVETLHADVTARIVDSVRVLHLESACVDLLTMNLERPLEAQNGVVLNVAAQPDYAPFLAHAEAMRSIGQALVATVAPEPNDCRIPIVSITGTNGKTTTTRLIAHLVRQQFDTVGMACTEGVYLNDRRIQSGDCSGPKSARLVLQHPTSQCAVLETARGGILREGLGFDRCDAAVVTNIGEGDHLGLNDIDTLEQLAEVKGTIVWTVKATGVAVLNAADPHVVSMAKHNPGTTTYFALAETEPVLTAHLSQGGTGVFIRNGSIIFHEGKQETILIELTRVPLTHGGKVDFQVENCLAAVGAARGVGLSFDAIRQGLASFDPFLSQVPGRFNLIDMKGATLVLDYGHNTSSLRCILQAMARFPHRHRTAVYSAAGDRRDCDILEQGALLGQYFDRVYIYEDAYIRGRQPGEITALFREGMTKGPRVRETYAVQGGNAAIEQALAASQPGDLLLLQPDVIDTAVELLRTLMAQGGREMTLDVALTVVEATPLKTEPRHDLLELREMHLGTGVYAARDLQPGEELFRGWGPTTYERSKYTIQVDHHLHIVPPSPLKFLNHSCDPNCGLIIRQGQSEMQLHAIRPIPAGEELTLDYETFETEIVALTGVCQCSAARCRGRLYGYRALPEELRREYGRYVAEYLRHADMPPMVAANIGCATVGVD